MMSGHCKMKTQGKQRMTVNDDTQKQMREEVSQPEIQELGWRT